MIIKVLGSGQDAGIPQIGCYCEICNKARNDESYRRLGPSIAIVDKEQSFCYMIDASPDFKQQIDLIREEIDRTEREGKIPLTGLLLTHAHAGHCAGLLSLGKEKADEKALPLYCTPAMKHFLTNNYPFSLLVERGNIIIEEIQPNKRLELLGIGIIPIQVPHRNEMADTVAYIIEADKRVIYIPDVDDWTPELIEGIRLSDVALIDGTFYSEEELPRFDEVPHPPMCKTIKLLEGAETEVYFTHINHTNPINCIDGIERKQLKYMGFKIAYDGLVIEI